MVTSWISEISRRLVFQLGAHSGQELLLLDRLGDVIGAAHQKAGQFLFGIRQSRQENHREVARVPIGFQATAGFKAINTGHHHIEQNQVRQT